MTLPAPLTITPLSGIPLVAPGTDLGTLLITALEAAALPLRSGDVLVVAQKIVSKAEGRYVDLATVEPSARARALGIETDKDPRLVEVILSESRAVVRHRPGVLIVEHHLGHVMANAGVDRSNVAPEAGTEPVLLLPRDPDASAAAWRNGTVGVALGVAGLPALLDLRGRPDLYGRALRVSETGFADEIAAAASLVMGQSDEAAPAVLVRGLQWSGTALPATALLRPAAQDLFR